MIVLIANHRQRLLFEFFVILAARERPCGVDEFCVLFFIVVLLIF
jgi:hypothetical protein